jgi:ornithine carbamoyltransferase
MPLTPSPALTPVYTDTWTSMGHEKEAELRRGIFAPYQVNDELMSLAKPGALFMHCLPAHRGEEVTAMSSNRTRLSSSIRPRTACTVRRRCC